MNEFDLTACPLSGTHCITAGAGTGKTFAISHLFLRLLLEKELDVDSILVVTFTEAATKELRARIRDVIQAALNTASGEGADTGIGVIVGRCGALKGAEYTRALLYKALYRFDEAPVCTIHSFCKRILKDNAFESSMRLDTELMTDQQPIILETVQDFWRINFYSASPFLTHFARYRGWSPQKLYDLVYLHLAQPDLELTPKTVPADTASAEQSFAEAFSAVAEAWPVVKEEIWKILYEDGVLSGTVYKKKSGQQLFDAFDAFAVYGAHTPELFKNFDKFTLQEILAAVKKGKQAPDHCFFRLCDALYEGSNRLCTLLDRNLVALKYACFNYVINALLIKKQLHNISTFDDLLTNLYRALQGANKKKLVRSIRKKYHAALIDEFQDTDPVQYAIFKPLFADGETPLFLIGDPKQAIYSFRGADIFTFITAVQDTDAQNQFTLQKNYRSSIQYIQALNTVFLSKPDPFVFNSIPYFEAIKPDKNAYSCSLSIDGRPTAPLCLWYLSSARYSHKKNSDQQVGPVSKEAASGILCNAVAGEIARILMYGRITAGNASGDVKPSDIAVLVRTRFQAREIKQALSSAGIPAVLYNAGNIFDTIDACEIYHVLCAVAYPQNHGYIRSALCTSLFGLDANTLYNAAELDNSIEVFYDEFRQYHELWNRSGCIAAFNSLISRRQVRTKLLSLPEGDRRLTNVLHLQDLLQQQCVENRLSMPQLINWLGARLNPDSPRLEEHELRLEKDDTAVQVVTIHKSKGLQYPVVFCPFTWADSHVSADEFIFHNEDNKRIYEIGGPDYDKHKKQAQKELLAENIRLLYVALSRAKFQCYLGWGRINKTEASAPAYLFHRPDNLDAADPVSSLGASMKKLGDGDLLRDLENLAARSNGCVEIVDYIQKPLIRYTSPDEGHGDLMCRTFSAVIPAPKRLSSFTALIHATRAATETHDAEELYSAEKPAAGGFASAPHQAEANIFTFPRGAEAGILLHSILQELDFSQNRSDALSTAIQTKLSLYGFAPDWTDTLLRSITSLLKVNLDPGFTLSMIPRENTCREMEFFYPLKTITPEKLRSIFRHGEVLLRETGIPSSLERLDFQPSKGYMHGFIDLLFMHNGKYYIVDWKSNHLGDSPESYAAQNLKQAMLSNSYYLQYFIYTLAVDRFLKSRIKDYAYDTHFGGVYYFFLRGISEDPNAGNGVFFDRPDIQIIERLNRELIGK